MMLMMMMMMMMHFKVQYTDNNAVSRCKEDLGIEGPSVN